MTIDVGGGVTHSQTTSSIEASAGQVSLFLSSRQSDGQSDLVMIFFITFLGLWGLGMAPLDVGPNSTHVNFIDAPAVLIWKAKMTFQ